MKIIWTPDALQNLDGVYNFLAQVNERAAANTYNLILDKAYLLINHSRIGKVEPMLEKLRDEHRSLLVLRRYKIIYRINDETIIIVSIFDCRSNPADLAERIKE